MKKIYLAFIFGIFLLGIVSATVTVSVNTTRPVFYAELAKSDGTNNLSIGDNYYFQCFVGGYGYNGMSASPASEQFNITINSTHRWINISNIQNMCNSYTISAGGDKGIHCRWQINNSYTDWGGTGYQPASYADNESLINQGWIEQYGHPGWYYANNFKCDRGKDFQILTSNEFKSGTSYSGRYISHPEISIPLSRRNTLEKYFNITLGIADIYIDETTNTWNDLVTAIQNSPAKDLSTVSENTLTIIGQIYGNGDLTFNKKSISIIGGDNDNPNLEFINSQWLVDNWGIHWHRTYGKFIDTDFLSIGNNDILDETTSADGLNYCGDTAATHYGNYDGWTFNCLPTFHQTRYTSNGNTFSNSVWNGIYDYVTPIADNGTVYFENDTFNNNGEKNYDIYTYLRSISCNYPNHWQNFDMKNVISNREDKRLKIYYVVNGDLCGYTQNFTFHGDVKFTIIDKNGNAIENANITLSNEHNTYTNLTDANGKLIHDVDFYMKYINQTLATAGINHYALTQERGNYNLTITASDYAKYSTNVNINSPQDWTISLEERTWNYSQPLIMEQLNNSLIGIMAIDTLGNMKIAGNLIENTNSSYINSIPNSEVKWRINDYLVLTKRGTLYLLGELVEGII
jgi:hypothetical protein